MGNYLWIVGCGVSMLGSICSNFGLNIQKYSLNQNTAKVEKEQIHHCKQPYALFYFRFFLFMEMKCLWFVYVCRMWLLGFSLVIFGALADFAALSLAAQSIVAPIGSVTLLANLFFAYFWLGEKLTKIDIIGTVMVTVGSVISAAFGDHSSPTYTIEDIQRFWANTVFIIFICILGLVLLICFVVIRWLEPIRDDLEAAYIAYGIASTIFM